MFLTSPGAQGKEETTDRHAGAGKSLTCSVGLLLPVGLGLCASLNEATALEKTREIISELRK